MLTYWETLIATRSNIAVNDSYAALWGKKSQNNYTVETYTGPLPATLQTAAGYLESYKIYGNTVQNGTPTPENPIMPEGCGEKTVNLYNINAKDENNGYINNAQLTQDGTVVTWGTAEISEYIPISGDTAYTFNGIGSYNSPCYALYDESKQLIGAYRYNGRSIINFTSPSNARYFRFTHIKTYPRTMMVEGTYTSSTMPEYEPYGYKLPILSNSTLTNIYLGKMETTRRIKKLVLTGDETISSVAESTLEPGAYCFACLYSDLGMTDITDYDLDMRNIPYPHYVCDHFRMRATPTQTVLYTDLYAGYMGANTIQGSGPSNRTFNRYVIFCVSGISTVAEFKTYLQQQYANGTPMTVWYILAEPETGMVNEPLMKIGNYTDTISMEQAGVNIPTTAVSTTISWAGEGLAPSEVELVYKVKR